MPLLEIDRLSGGIHRRHSEGLRAARSDIGVAWADVARFGASRTEMSSGTTAMARMCQTACPCSTLIGKHSGAPDRDKTQILKGNCEGRERE